MSLTCTCSFSCRILIYRNVHNRSITAESNLAVMTEDFHIIGKKGETANGASVPIQVSFLRIA